MLAVYAIVNGNENGWTPAQTLGLLAAAVVLLAVFLSSRPRRARRSCRCASSSSATSRPPTSSGSCWAAAMFAWFFLSALYLQLVLGYSPLQVGLAFLPANLIMGAFSLGLSAKLVMRFGIRPPLVVGLGLAAARAAAVRARAGRRQLRRRHPARHDPARHRRRHRVQPGAAGRDERRRAERVRPRLRARQHRVHDGRRARARRAREPRRLAHGRPPRFRASDLAALTGGYQLAFVVSTVFAVGAAAIAGLLLRPGVAPQPAVAHGEVATELD